MGEPNMDRGPALQAREGPGVRPWGTFSVVTTPRSQAEELGGAGRWPPGRRWVHIRAAEF